MVSPFTVQFSLSRATDCHRVTPTDIFGRESLQTASPPPPHPPPDPPPPPHPGPAARSKPENILLPERVSPRKFPKSSSHGTGCGSENLQILPPA